MKTIELYEKYKKENEKKLIIIKEGIFYKTFFMDATIFWYIFDYKLLSNCISFGVNSYEKVLDKLMKLELGFLIIENQNEVVKRAGDQEIYDYHYLLAKKSLERQRSKEELFKNIEKLLYDDVENYKKLEEFIKNLQTHS